MVVRGFVHAYLKSWQTMDKTKTKIVPEVTAYNNLLIAKIINFKTKAIIKFSHVYIEIKCCERKLIVR